MLALNPYGILGPSIGNVETNHMTALNSSKWTLYTLKYLLIVIFFKVTQLNTVNIQKNLIISNKLVMVMLNCHTTMVDIKRLNNKIGGCQAMCITFYL